ncbi:premnaspirodiene oxygenase-like [Salvia hispanica]|uniref:premnaspirodiene oxygenase-like n=1 Tax=Salvia hispanica TaxID=49212 RepID=UPI002009B3DE|nr:premnaspirodiene oxygenase-like [Salvia hispanica]
MLYLITALILPAIFIFFKKWKKSKNGNPTKQLPPGPRKLPIIGNLHQMRNPPFRRFRDLSNHHGPLMHLKLGDCNAIVVSSPEIAKEMLKDLDPSFANRPQNIATKIMWYNSSDVVFCPYNDYWRQMRKLCINELLSPKMVRLFESIRRDETARLVDSLRESSGSYVNFTEKIFSLSSSITCRAAFGSACEDSDTLMKMIGDTLRMAAGFEVTDLFPSSRIAAALSWGKVRYMRKMRRKLDVILDDIIDRHRRNRAKIAPGDGRRLGNSEFGGEDLVDVFLRVKEEEELKFPIDNHNIKAVLFDLLTGGTDTSAEIVDWAMVELLRHPRVMAKAQAEVRQALKENPSIEQNNTVYNLKYLKLVIKETLRLHPPGPMLPRSSNKEHSINGYTIPAGAMVFVNVWAMHRDPRHWKDPERFEPERFEDKALDFTGGDFEYLPFGTGKRMCPGMTFGLATVESALAQMLYHFDWKLPEGVKAEDLDMIETVGVSAPRKQNLFVVATPYKLAH